MAKTKIAVDMGHCPKSEGAVGFLHERKQDRAIGYELISLLKEHGYEVINVTPKDSEEENLSKRAEKANKAKANLFVSIHLNAGHGTGTEVYTVEGSKAIPKAKKVSKLVSETLHIHNRGHKTANFTVIAKSSMPAMLVEVCFVDNTTDAKAYKSSSPKKVAMAIFEGITGKKPCTGFKSYDVKVTKDNLPVRRGAGVKFSAIEYYKKDKKVTIISEKGKWGKTKLGWIYLPYTEKVK